VIALSAVALFTNSAANAASTTAKIEQYQRKTDALIEVTHQRQRLMDASVTPTSRSYRRTHSARYAQWVYRYWRRTNRRVMSAYREVPFRDAWQCIHRYEGSWQDSGGPYYGGLQMDISFQSHYGGYLFATKGTADHWTPLEQMWVAARAYRSGRGFYPWPATARMCGLL
jgi:hypothetical protein